MNIPNFLTLLRILLVPILIIFLIEGKGSYAFMVFVLLYMPCIVTAAAFKQEFGTWKWFGVAVAYEMVLAWGVAFIIYQGGTLLGIGV